VRLVGVKFSGFRGNQHPVSRLDCRFFESSIDNHLSNEVSYEVVGKGIDFLKKTIYHKNLFLIFCEFNDIGIAANPVIQYFAVY